LELKTDSLEEEVRDAVKKWRFRVLEKSSRLENGRDRSKVREISFNMFSTPFRPFFRKLDSNDTIYVSTHRAFIYGLRKCGSSTRALVLRTSGYDLGKHFIQSREIRNLDDVPKVLAKHRIGLVDIVRESIDRFVVHIYECLSCSGLPNLGESLCDFEAGVLQGVFEALIGKNIVIEKQCWALGNAYCGFEIIFL